MTQEEGAAGWGQRLAKGGHYEGNKIICLGITHDLHLEKRHVIMFLASKVTIMEPQWNIPTWPHSCKTISHTKADIHKFNRNFQQNYFYHDDITQVTSCWLLIAEIQVQSHDSLCKIYGGQGSTGPSTSVSSYQLHSTDPLCHLSLEQTHMRPQSHPTSITSIIIKILME